MAPDTSATADTLLAAVVAALDDPPARQLISWAAPAWEACKVDQVAVYWQAGKHKQTRGPRAVQVQRRVEWHVQLVRCHPGIGDRGSAPAADVLTAAAQGLLAEWDQVNREVLQQASMIFGAGAQDIEFGDARPLGPSGLAAAWDWPIIAGT